MITFEDVSKILADRKISKTEFYKAIGMTAAGFKRALAKGTMKVDTAQKIREFLGMTRMSAWDVLFGGFAPKHAEPDFFGDAAPGTDYKSLYEECRKERDTLLREAVAREQKIIQLMEEKEKVKVKPGRSSS